MQYGSFDPYHFCIDSSSGPGGILDEQGVASYVANHSVDVQVDRAMRDVTLLHELRHLHDSFGTIAGLTFFWTHISRLKAFSNVLKRLKQDKLRLRLPLHEWADEPTCPDYVREFSTRIMGGLVTEAVFLGKAPPQDATGKQHEPFIEVRLGRSRFPAFPMQLGVSATGPSGQPTPPAIRTIAIPIGMEHLLEGNAQALQRTMLQAVWPAHVEERVLERMRVHWVAGDLSEVKSFLTLPYNITDLALSRYLRLRHGIEKFPRARLTELTDRALMVARSLGHGDAGPAPLPGGAFVTLMERIDWKTKVHQALFQDEEPEHDDRPTLTRMIDALRGAQTPDQLFESDPAPNPIDVCDAFATHHLALPLLQLRLAHGPSVLSSFEGYMAQFAQMPVAPVVSTPGGLSLSNDMNERMLRTWTRYAMFSQLALQVWRGADSLKCPRAFNFVAGLESVEYNAPSGCVAEVDGGRCPEWRVGDARAAPNCYFSHMLRTFSLR